MCAGKRRRRPAGVCDSCCTGVQNPLLRALTDPDQQLQLVLAKESDAAAVCIQSVSTYLSSTYCVVVYSSLESTARSEPHASTLRVCQIPGYPPDFLFIGLWVPLGQGGYVAAADMPLRVVVDDRPGTFSRHIVPI